MLSRLAEEDGRARPALEPPPGYFARRRRTLPPAEDILARIPEGAVLS
jgi:hypothetical protein